MSILTKKTPLEKATEQCAESKHYGVTVLNSAWNQIWNRDPEAVAAELNADPVKTNLLLSLYRNAAEADNAILDSIKATLPEGEADPYPTRAPVEMPANWSVENGVFIYTPPPAPEVIDNGPPQLVDGQNP